MEAERIYHILKCPDCDYPIKIFVPDRLGNDTLCPGCGIYLQLEFKLGQTTEFYFVSSKPILMKK